MSEISLLRVCRIAAALTAIGALACFLLLRAGVGAGILLGGLLTILNLWWLQDSFDALLPQGDGRRARAFARFLVRLALTGAVLAVVVRSGQAILLGFIGGHLTLLAAILAEVLRVDLGRDARGAGAPSGKVGH